jgi:hypothetical protein
MASPHRVLEEEERPGAAEGAVERAGEAVGVLGHHRLGQLQGDAGHAGQQIHSRLHLAGVDHDDGVDTHTHHGAQQAEGQVGQHREEAAVIGPVWEEKVGLNSNCDLLHQGSRGHWAEAGGRSVSHPGSNKQGSETKKLHCKEP